MLMATLQGLVASALLYAAFCGPMAVYALLRYGSGEMAWFTCAAFFLAAMYVTQVRCSRPPASPTRHLPSGPLTSCHFWSEAEPLCSKSCCVSQREGSSAPLIPHMRI